MMLTPEECRAQAAECVQLGTVADVSPWRAAKLAEIARKWDALAWEIERLGRGAPPIIEGSDIITITLLMRGARGQTFTMFPRHGASSTSTST
jgi:hypothetical protein